MDEELKQRLVTLMDSLASAASGAKGFALEQAPEVAREIVAWTFWSALCGAILGVAVFCFGLWVAGEDKEQDEKEKKEREARRPTNLHEAWLCDDFGDSLMGNPLIGLLVVVCLVAGSLMTVMNAKSLIKATVSPRLVVLDYVRSAVK